MDEITEFTFSKENFDEDLYHFIIYKILSYEECKNYDILCYSLFRLHITFTNDVTITVHNRTNRFQITNNKITYAQSLSYPDEFAYGDLSKLNVIRMCNILPVYNIRNSQIQNYKAYIRDIEIINTPIDKQHFNEVIANGQLEIDWDIYSNEMIKYNNNSKFKLKYGYDISQYDEWKKNKDMYDLFAEIFREEQKIKEHYTFVKEWEKNGYVLK